MKKGFDNAKYLQMQSQHIRERIAQFDNKLYLEFGGKLFDDYHASRVLPGFDDTCGILSALMRVFSSEDLPLFDRPMNAISVAAGGNSFASLNLPR